ncbi:tetratricopeptide repeat protein [Microvirga sp. STR05]|uniref:Tetratricopeptide repeat protein n=1 Tax=Hymenobacter duratus TaxID=2771356 RepID=A0ABR8JBE7_9BACT|nr:tetratricopeptide repeat protein [Hymenobacter duratus]MBD2714015.1 tetratricopeptide repeat protein [Hymenobacter duratus]MBR7948917.1 tetratricopeptide repeat protein [Microvirga sp. STR05]
MKYPLVAALGLVALLNLPAQAQRKTKIKTKDATVTAANRLQPLFGGIAAAQAEGLLSPGYVEKVAASFGSRAEASRFFSSKGYEYISEGQADTAITRFNLAWLLDAKNPEVYRGLGIVASKNPAPDQAIDLLTKGLALAPENALMLSDLGSSYLIRYEQTKKKKDLTTGIGYLQRALAADPNNAIAWQQMALAHYLQEDYTKAWEAVHKGQNISMTSIDFNFLSDLMAKMPDPEGKFK